MTANNSADEGLSKTPAGNGGEAPAVLDAGQPQSQTVAALTEQAGRDASTVALRQAELSAAQHADGVKRVAGKAALAVVIVAGLIAAFALINWAIVNALSPSLPGWQAPLVVAAAWITLSTALLAILFPAASQAASPTRPAQRPHRAGRDNQTASTATRTVRTEAARDARAALERDRKRCRGTDRIRHPPPGRWHGRGRRRNGRSKRRDHRSRRRDHRRPRRQNPRRNHHQPSRRHRPRTRTLRHQNRQRSPHPQQARRVSTEHSRATPPLQTGARSSLACDRGEAAEQARPRPSPHQQPPETRRRRTAAALFERTASQRLPQPSHPGSAAEEPSPTRKRPRQRGRDRSPSPCGQRRCFHQAAAPATPQLPLETLTPASNASLDNIAPG